MNPQDSCLAGVQVWAEPTRLITAGADGKVTLNTFQSPALPRLHAWLAPRKAELPAAAPFACHALKLQVAMVDAATGVVHIAVPGLGRAAQPAARPLRATEHREVCSSWSAAVGWVIL